MADLPLPPDSASKKADPRKRWWRNLVGWVLFPKLSLATQTIPEIIDDFLQSNISGLVWGSVLFVVGLILGFGMAIAIALGFAYCVTVFWILRYKKFRSLEPTIRLVAMASCILILGVLFAGSGKLAIERYKVRQQAERRASAGRDSEAPAGNNQVAAKQEDSTTSEAAQSRVGEVKTNHPPVVQEAAPKQRTKQTSMPEVPTERQDTLHTADGIQVKKILPSIDVKVKKADNQSAVTPAPTINQNCPGGICAGGDITGNPTIINPPSPLPTISWDQEQVATNADQKPGVKVTFTVAHAWPNIAVGAECSAPCTAVKASAAGLLDSVQAYSKSNDRLVAVKIYAPVLESDYPVEWEIRSNTSTPIHLLRVFIVPRPPS
jgi:hypothetical protein